MSTTGRISYLFNLFINKTASLAETQELFSLIASSKNDPELHAFLEQQYVKTASVTQDWDWDFIFQQALQADKKVAVVTQHRIHFLKTTWFRYAAAVILLLGIGGYIFWRESSEIPAKARNDKANVVQTQPPNNKVILTLASGKKIELNNKTPLLVKEGAVFDPSEAGQKPGVATYNTITTPKGSQYQVILPDGTKAWLNALSSIKFPTTFTGNQRTIEITGEAYLEIAKNPKQPFYVKAATTEVQVLGTTFNINAYPDEKSIKTTLVNGSIKVSTGNSSELLKPGQQAQIDQTSHITIASGPAIVTQAIAWKEGIFNFEGANLREVMNQLQRWYDIEVIYETTIPNMTFFGEVDKKEDLSVVLETLKNMGIHFRLQGKKLIVTE